MSYNKRLIKNRKKISCLLNLSLGIHNYAPRHLDQAVDFLEKTILTYPYEDVLGPTYDLSDLSCAMKIAKEKVYNRVLIKPDF